MGKARRVPFLKGVDSFGLEDMEAKDIRIEAEQSKSYGGQFYYSRVGERMASRCGEVLSGASSRVSSDGKPEGSKWNPRCCSNHLGCSP